MVDYYIQPASALQGEIQLPGDKSISHRAVFCASLAEGVTQISGLSDGLDVRSTQHCMQQLGVMMRVDGQQCTIEGVGLHGLQIPRSQLDCGNSGTTMRLLLGILAGYDFQAELIGDSSLSQRPMQRVASPLCQMGVNIELTGGHAPVRIRGKKQLTALQYSLPIASAQVKSALLFAALFAKGTTVLQEPIATRDHSERLFSYLQYPVTQRGQSIQITGGQTFTAKPLSIPSDFSAAAFFIVAASICPGSNILLRSVSMNPERIGLLRILQAMGANVTLFNTATRCGEPIADLRIQSAKLTGVDVDARWVASMIDEFPILMIAAAAAEGVTTIQGASELRVKETDRITTMVTGLKQLGINVQETADGAIIQGGKIQGGEVDSHGDHRIAMAFCMAGSISESPILVRNCDNIATSFAQFYSVAQRCGLQILDYACK